MLDMEVRKVMLAPNKAIDFSSDLLKFPYLVSDKMDGMRAITINGEMYSRSMKKLRDGVHEYFLDFLIESEEAGLVFDGELYSTEVPFNKLMSTFSRGGADIPTHVRYCIFDMMTRDEWLNGTERPFASRVTECHSWLKYHQQRILNAFEAGGHSPTLSHAPPPARAIAVGQSVVECPEELRERFNGAMDRGYEGLIIRDPLGRYKHGRGTLNEGLIYKFKEWVTVDAKIIGYNRSTRMKKEYADSDRGKDELGRTKRTSAKDTREEIDGIGSIIVRSSDGVEFACGTDKDCDFTISWDTRDDFLDKYVEVRFMRHGVKDKPRFAGITRLRTDLSDSDDIESLASVLGR
jgi:ATP-dependent DNA ligase